MLWIEKYRPVKFEEICGQGEVLRHMQKFASEKNVPHLLIFGPHGTGKSVALESMAGDLYGGYLDENLSIIPSGVLFRQGKSWLENEDRFSHLYMKDESLITNFKHIVKWYASMKPLDADFKIVVFEEASSLPFDAQAALRRIMERYSQTCRFVFIAKQQTSIIPAIASRCLPLFFSPLEAEEIISVMQNVLRKEGVLPGTVSDDDLEIIAQLSRGDCRKALIYLQVMVTKGGDVDFSEITGSETSAISSSLFSYLMKGDLKRSKEIAEMLMTEYGLSGTDVVLEISKAAKREYNDKRIAVALSDADHNLCHAGNEFIQVNALLARVIKEVFN
ncbi:replication protein C [Methanoplanus sp. FWC-SCC4]|uniref:Replication factor C small subunit n=1 Tax=Methanochimaera problematica TaxID=2609417 RepID=A0AA97I2I9_9EURY|nr:replication protein C [Methanoplanus sp. FWC-SCC4]WOF16320.1 replication protein C [Methanoplanus sp. FWC-SCC4]